MTYYDWQVTHTEVGTPKHQRDFGVSSLLEFT
jgi:hypothetical protein